MLRSACVLVVVAGCGETRDLTQEHCLIVGDRLEAAWNNDALVAQDRARTEEFTRFIGTEQSAIREEWMAACSARVGRKVELEELQCLLAIDTLDDAQECGKHE